MQTTGTFWKSVSKVGQWIAKAVISKTGHVVAKNYKAEELEAGDVGITIRLNKRDTGEMTPEQRLSLQGLAREMCREFLKVLGVHEEEGFSPGMVVMASIRESYLYYALIVRMSDMGITAKTFNDKGQLVLRFIALTDCVLEEMPGLTGLHGLIVISASNGQVVSNKYIDMVTSKTDLKIIAEKGEPSTRVRAMVKLGINLKEVARTHIHEKVRLAALEAIPFDPANLAFYEEIKQLAESLETLMGPNYRSEDIRVAALRLAERARQALQEGEQRKG